MKKACSTAQVWRSFSAEERKVAEVFLQDFEKSAIHLPQQQRHRFVALQDEILTLATAFSQNIHLAEDREPATLPVSWLKTSPPCLLEKLKDDKDIKLQGSTAEIPAHHPLLYDIVRSSPDPRAREVAYKAAFASGPSQKHLLDHLLTRRAELARLTGFASFAHMTLQDKLAGSPGKRRHASADDEIRADASYDAIDVVDRFLSSQLDSLRSSLPEEESRLLREVQPSHARLAPWDRDYALQQRANCLHATPIGPFLSVGKVFSGISTLVKQLFGLQLTLKTPDRGELWCDEVLKFEVMDEDEGGAVGTIYADLWSRPGKPAGAAHFTLRCSRRLDWDRQGMSGASEKDVLSGPVTTYKTRPGEFQRPVVALLCDFRKPSSTGPPLLAWAEVETLLHEVGHAIHCRSATALQAGEVRSTDSLPVQR